MIYSAFCGTGKSYLCDKSGFMELECWKYDLKNFPKNYIEDIKYYMNKTDFLFISTNPVVLKELSNQSIDFLLVYPDINLKSEYMQRYKDRGSSDDFIKMLNTNWYNWISELDELNFNKIILNKNEYLENKIWKTTQML